MCSRLDLTTSPGNLGWTNKVFGYYLLGFSDRWTDYTKYLPSLIKLEVDSTLLSVDNENGRLVRTGEKSRRLWEGGIGVDLVKETPRQYWG